MATRRKSIHNTSSLNFRPSKLDDTTKLERGTKPTTKESTVKEVFAIMILHICKKSLFFDTNLKVAFYLGALFLISLIADVITIPRGYLSRTDNMFNQYFVKFAWGWNLTVVVPYVVLTSYVYCCGNKQKILKNHLARIFVATFFWWSWTTLFNIIEANYGKCNMKGNQYNHKQSCLKDGYYWNGFDVSGHCFILIYGSLLLIEENRSIINWDCIKDYIRLESHYRITKDTSHNTNPLKALSAQELEILKASYEKFTPYIRGLFVAATAFQILWDVMLICTMLYHHIMIEKFLGGAIAIITWYFTYRFWFPSTTFLPKLPGVGMFKYSKMKTTTPVIRKRMSSTLNGSQAGFMGKYLRAESASSEIRDDFLRQSVL